MSNVEESSIPERWYQWLAIQSVMCYSSFLDNMNISLTSTARKFTRHSNFASELCLADTTGKVRVNPTYLLPAYYMDVCTYQKNEILLFPDCTADVVQRYI